MEKSKVVELTDKNLELLIRGLYSIRPDDIIEESEVIKLRDELELERSELI